MTEQRRHSILLVDDEPEILFSLKGLLRREFDLYTAESGDEALKILQERPINVIMTDQRMPGMTGVELMRRARVSHPEAIRIVFTGYADIKAVVEAINSGGLYRYITKPWDPEDLIEMLHQAATKYDEIVSQNHLYSEARRYVETGNDLVAWLRKEHPEILSGYTDLEKHGELGDALLARLNSLLNTASNE